MPSPNLGESLDDFVVRCTPMMLRDGAVDSREQALAVCSAMYERHQKVRAAASAGIEVLEGQVRGRATGLAMGAEMRVASLHGRQHYVVPVVALVANSVVRPMNSLGPEMVPASALAHAPAGWDGRPVVPDHPDGGRSSANTPRMLETFAFGQLFGTRYENYRLLTEAWLDPERARRVGPLAEAVIRRLRDKKSVEVSVGCYVSAVRSPGRTNAGQDYEYVWSEIVPDHLAMLPEGVEGACSITMGCGAPRAARSLRLVRPRGDR